MCRGHQTDPNLDDENSQNQTTTTTTTTIPTNFGSTMSLHFMAWDIPPIVASPYYIGNNASPANTYSTTVQEGVGSSEGNEGTRKKTTGTSLTLSSTSPANLTTGGPHEQQEQEQQEETPTFQGPFWKTRSCRLQTPQHLSSILLLSDVPDMTSEDLPKDGLGGQGSNTKEGDVVINSRDGNSTTRSTAFNVEQSGDGEDDDDEDEDNNGDDGDDTSILVPPRIQKTPVENDFLETSTYDVASTACCSCPPMVWQQKVLVIALTSGEIRVYGDLLGSTFSDNISPTMGTTADISNPVENLYSATAGTTSWTTAPPAFTAPPTTNYIPLATLHLPSDGTIVQLIPMVVPSVPSEGEDSLPVEKSGNDWSSPASSFLALSVEGHVYSIRLVQSVENNNTRTKDTSIATITSYRLDLEHFWNTGNCGATCMVLVPTTSSVGGNKTTDTIISKPATTNHQLWLIIGYTSGLIECWNLGLSLDSGTATASSSTSSLPSSSRGFGRQPAISAARPHRRPRRQRPECLWKGIMVADDANSIVSLQLLDSPRTTAVDCTTTEEESTSNRILDSDHAVEMPKDGLATLTEPLLVMTLQPLIGDDPPSLQVFNLNGIHRNILTLVRPRRVPCRQDDESAESTSCPTIDLSPFRVLPDPAMALIESTTTPVTATIESASNSTVVIPPSANSLDKHDGEQEQANESNHPYLPTKLNSILVPSRGTNASISLGSRCGVALSNGTVAILSPGWGVASDTDQLLLSYPAIGMGRIHFQDSISRQKTEYMVCCLRAGTCYLIPITDSDVERGVTAESINPREIPVVFYPHDIDADVTNLYVQDFTAGVLRCQSDDEKATSFVPILVFVLPGGAVDIYSIDLRVPTRRTQDPYPAPPSDEDQALQELVHNGTLVQLLDALQGGCNNVPADLSEIWNKAKEEVHTLGRLPESLYDVNRAPALRHLLLELSV